MQSQWASGRPWEAIGVQGGYADSICTYNCAHLLQRQTHGVQWNLLPPKMYGGVGPNELHKTYIQVAQED